MVNLRLLRAWLILALIATFPLFARGIGAAGDTEWPAGASVEAQLTLAATIEKDGLPKIQGILTVINPGKTTLTVQKPTNRLVLAFAVFDSLGNLVAPDLRGKADPAFETRLLEAGAKYSHSFDGLEFVTDSVLCGYNLKRGQRYRVIAIYRPAGHNGPGFTTDEVVVQIPD